MRDAAERALDIIAQVGDALLCDVDRRGAGFDLGEIEDVVDQREQIGTGAADRRCHLDLFAGEILIAVIDELLREDEQRVERRAQFVRHVGEELRLVFRGERELLGFLLERAARFFDLAGALLDFFVLLGQQARFLLELFVGRTELFLLRLQFGRERLRLLEQFFRSHVGRDRIEHDADRLGELIEEE